MAAVALVLYVTWALVAFGLRTLVQVRRTGDTGLRLGGGRPGSVEWFAKVLFVVALVLGVAAPVAELAGWSTLVPALERSGIAWVGVVVTVVGILATVGAQIRMGDSWRIGVDAAERTELVTGGPFSLVRNPIFTAMLVTTVGLVLMVPNVVALIGLLVLVVGLELQVRVVEEPYLRAAHGVVYVAYERRVGRFVPGLGRARRTVTPSP